MKVPDQPPTVAQLESEIADLKRKIEMQRGVENGLFSKIVGAQAQAARAAPIPVSEQMTKVEFHASNLTTLRSEIAEHIKQLEEKRASLTELKRRQADDKE